MTTVIGDKVIEWLNQQTRCTWTLEEYGFFCAHGLRLPEAFVERAMKRTGA